MQRVAVFRSIISDCQSNVSPIGESKRTDGYFILVACQRRADSHSNRLNLELYECHVSERVDYSSSHNHVGVTIQFGVGGHAAVTITMITTIGL